MAADGLDAGMLVSTLESWAGEVVTTGALL